MEKLVGILFSFKGRINRWQWWTVQLFLIVPGAIGFDYYMEEMVWDSEWPKALGILFALLVSYIHFSICAKRYHDIDRTGWRQLIVLIPLLGDIWLFIECGFKEGNPESNLYGYPNVVGKRSMYDRGESAPFDETDHPADQKIIEPIDRGVRAKADNIYS